MKKRIAKAFCLLIVLSLLISTPFSAEEKTQKVDLKGFDTFVTKQWRNGKSPGSGYPLLRMGKSFFLKDLAFGM